MACCKYLYPIMAYHGIYFLACASCVVYYSSLLTVALISLQVFATFDLTP